MFHSMAKARAKAKPVRPKKKVIKQSSKLKSVARYPINGVGAVPRRNFGGGSSGGNPLLCMDATIPRHLALPINVGPYTVTRTTTVVKSSAPVSGFGFFRTLESLAQGTPAIASQREGWAPMVGFAAPNATGAPNVFTKFYGCPQLKELGESATLAPAAMTVQIMDSNSLSGSDAAKGVLYVGASKTQMRLKDSNQTWDSIGQDFVSFQAPRLCSGPKLALRGVKVNARPFNVTELMDFDVVVPNLLSDGDLTYGDKVAPWSSTAVGGPTDESKELQTHSLKGFSPIMVYNPNLEELQFIVTCEWRVRYNYGHPASSTHQVHNAASTRTWDILQKGMDALGHGCVDIVEDIAQQGALAIRNATYNMGRRAIGRGMPMLMG